MNLSLGRVADPREYEEWLSEIDAVGGELAWIRKRKVFPRNPTGIERSPAEINASVLHSRQVKDAIEAEAKRRGIEKKEVRAEAAQIIFNMAQAFNLTSVQVVGYGVVKVIKNLFDAIYVNLQALRSLRERLNNDSIVFMPTHKTYADFLLLSLLCYHEDVTLPAIAAGSDFQQSYFMGEALRRCGAFFIRRSFGQDALYWAIFSEYVQTHLVHADRPVEFFVEGTRSRTGKSLHPKYGTLQCLLEPYLRAQVYDLVIVPVTMNYDKVLEESLYAYELLGFPKPKETTSGLLRARHILSKSFGNVYITFSDSISVRSILEPKINRCQLSFYPAREFSLDFDAKTAIRKFGHEIVEIHNQNNIVTIWPYACLMLAEIADETAATEPPQIYFSDLLHRLHAFLSLTQRLQIQVQINSSIEADLRNYLHLHGDLFHPFDQTTADFPLKFAEMPINKESNFNPSLLQKSVAAIIFSNYANQAMFFFTDIGYICASLLIPPTPSDEMGTTTTAINRLKIDFSFLQSMFTNEFVFVPGEFESHFNTAIQRLVEAKIIHVTSQSIIEVIDEEAAHQIARLITPFIRAYGLVFRILLTTSPDRLALLTGKSIIPFLQQEIAKVIEAETSHYRLAFLNHELIKNAFHALLKRKIAVVKPWNAIILDRMRLSDYIREVMKFDEILPADSVEVDIVPRSRI